MSKIDTKNKEHLSELEKRLSKSMFLGGDKPSAEDREVFDNFGDDSVSASEYPGIAGWYYVVRYFNPELRTTWGLDEKKPSNTNKPTNTNKNKNTEKAPAAPAEEEDDLFGEDEETEEDKKKRAEKKQKDLEAKKAANLKKEEEKKKAAPIGKSLILLDVKVYEQDTDFDALAKEVLGITMDGLTWKTENKTPEICFGMKKLTVGMVVVDELVSVDDVIETIEKNKEIVQSVDIVSFDKI